MKKLIALILLLPVLAFAQVSGSPHLKKENPNILAYYATSKPKGTCPIGTSVIDEVIESVFVRSRIKPIRHELDDNSNRQLFLFVTLTCYAPDDLQTIVFDLDVGFGQRVSIGRYGVPVRFKISSGYSLMGLGISDFYIQSQLKESVEKAITDYLRANFDLGDDK